MNEWVWLSDELPKFFNQSVLGPLRTASSLFTNDDVLPVQRFNLLFGRPGVGKRTALETLCERDKVSFSTLDAENLFEGTSKISLTEKHTSVEVLIIEHANSLIVGPYATQWTRNFALDLKSIAQANKIFIFCLCDIVPKNMTQGDRDLLAVQFLRNFNATIYFKAPTANAREHMFRRRIALMFDHLEMVAKKLNVDLNTFCATTADGLKDEDYKMLTDASHHCTPLQITKFIQRVALVCVSTQSSDGVLNTELLKRCLYPKGPGDYSITEENSARAESSFAADAGQSIPSGRAAKEHEQKRKAVEEKTQVDSFLAEPPVEEPTTKKRKQ